MMNAQLLDISAFRCYEFPITIKKVFLAHAASSPLPRRVSTAMTQYIETASGEGQWEYIYDKTVDEARRLSARLIGAKSEEIAFVSSTSVGLSIVASGIDWHEGDNVIVADGDFPANIYPWLNLQGRGVKVKFIPRNVNGSVTPEDIMSLIDAGTRLVSLSTVNYVTGYRIDVSAIGRLLKEKGILFCVDAIQSLGAVPLDVSYIDFLACGSHKWLLGPLGVGILYVKKNNIGDIGPVITGWKSVQSSKNYLDYDLRFLDNAGRFEPGGMNIAGIIGLHAALGLLLETGISEIAAKITKFRRIIRPALMEKGYDVLGFTDDESSSGIVSFCSRIGDVAGLRQELDDSGYVVSLRDGLDGRKCIRVAPHFYNSEDEIHQLLERIPRC